MSVEDTLDSLNLLINSFTRPAYVAPGIAIEYVVQAADTYWTTIDCAASGNKIVIEPKLNAQIFQLTNFDTDTVIYIRKPMGDCEEFYITSIDAGGITFDNLLPFSSDVTLQLVDLESNTVMRCRFMWDGTNLIWRNLQVRVA